MQVEFPFIHNADKIRPILSNTALIEGHKLVMMSASEEFTVRAPKHYLRKSHEWCRGDKTLREISVLAQKTWGDDAFVNFIQDMLTAGVMIDAATFLIHASRRAEYPNMMGLPPSEKDWVLENATLLNALPEHAIPLPQFEESSLNSILKKDASARRFKRGSIELGKLVQLLKCAYGVVSDNKPSHVLGNIHRTVASAGAFCRIELTLILLVPIEQLCAGVYYVHYDVHGNVGLCLASGDFSLLPRCLLQPQKLRNAIGMIVLTSPLQASALKYGNRAYPVALIQAGGITQNIGMASAEQDLGWQVLGEISEKHLRAMCLLDDSSSVLVAGIFGIPNDCAGIGEGECEFSWIENLPDAPFHIACARIKATQAPPDFSWGRSKDPATAFIKAVAEAAERYAYRQTPVVRKSKIADLENVIDPRAIVRYTASQYRTKSFPFQPFRRDKEYSWASMYEVDSGTELFVLSEFIYDPFPDNVQLNVDKYTSTNSSGCASNTSLDIAIVNATLELIERDAFMRHWFAQKAGVELIFETLPIEIRQRISNLQTLGSQVSLQYLDLGLSPVFMALIQNSGRHFTSVGAAADLDPELALDKALSEAEAGAFAFLGGVVGQKILPKNVLTPTDHVSLYSSRVYFKKADALLKSDGRKSFLEIAELSIGTPRELYSTLQKNGYLHLWKDISIQNPPRDMEGLPISTVRVIVPGLIPMAFGYGRMPLGMDDFHIPASRFPHPFP